MFDYEDAIKKVKYILTSETEIDFCEKIPKNESEFTYDNGVKAWVGALFVDIRKSTKYFKSLNEVLVSKVMRAFFSEIVSILRSDDNLRDIGIRGDCVYGIFSTPTKGDIANIFNNALIIDKFQKLFQNELYKNNIPGFKIGIGLGCGKDFVVKTGKKGSGVYDYIWIGNAVIDASNLSSIAGDNGVGTIAMNDCFHRSLFYKNGNPIVNEVFKAKSKFVAEIETNIWYF